MKLFIDTANINEIKEANALGVIDGVTTNPTLIALIKHPLTDIGIERFLKDWQNVPKK